MITKSAMAAISAVAAIAGGTVAVESRYEKQSAAAAEYTQLANDQENARVRTQLDVIAIKLQRFKDLAKSRPLTEEEQIDLRSLEAERAALLNRLAQKS